MKWIAFGAFILVGVPCMTALAGSSKRGRWLLMAALIASTVVKVSVNFASLEDYRGPDRGFEVSLADLIALSLGLGLVIPLLAEGGLVPGKHAALRGLSGHRHHRLHTGPRSTTRGVHTVQVDEDHTSLLGSFQHVLV